MHTRRAPLSWWRGTGRLILFFNRGNLTSERNHPFVAFSTPLPYTFMFVVNRPTLALSISITKRCTKLVTVQGENTRHKGLGIQILERTSRWQQLKAKCEAFLSPGLWSWTCLGIIFQPLTPAMLLLKCFPILFFLFLLFHHCPSAASSFTPSLFSGSSVYIWQWERTI
jgi:hypothetical protein